MDSGLGWSVLGVLTAVDQVYMIVAFAIVWHSLLALPTRWAVAGTLAYTGVVVGIRAGQDGGPGDAVFGTLLPMGGAIAAVLFMYAIAEQSKKRQHLIEQLRATRGDLAAAEHEAGMLQERQRLAGEIHDTLAQGFTSIVLHLEAAEEALPAGLTDPRRHVDQARRMARDSLKEARRMVWAMRPEALDEASLPEALTHLAERWSEDSGVVASTTATGTPQPLPADAEVTLYRAAQEALANVRKHAHASRVAITLSFMDDVTILDVQDNGVGFDLNQTLTGPNGASNGGDGGFGLTAMRQRVEQMGGVLQIESTPGEGATLVAELPTPVTRDVPATS